MAMVTIASGNDEELTVNITTESDADFSQTFVYKTPALVPVDLTGTSMHMSLRRNAIDVTVALKISSLSGNITYLDAINGNFMITIPQNELLILEPGAYVHSLIMVKGAAKTRIWGGTFIHSAGPSRDE
jgi:hypothetical protein